MKTVYIGSRRYSIEIEMEIRSKSVTEYIMREITHICRSMKKRAPGSEGEREAAEYMAKTLENDCGCDNVVTESFSLHPGAFYGYLYFSCVFDVLTCALFFVNGWCSIAAGVISLLLFLLQFVLYYEIIDPFFPKADSVNVTAIRPCSGETKRRIFINGHVDAAWEWPLNYYFNGIVLLSICRLAGAERWVLTAGLIGLIFVPAWIGLCFLRNKRLVVDGARLIRKIFLMFRLISIPLIRFTIRSF